MQGLPPAPLSKWINWTGASAAKGANAGLCASHILFFNVASMLSNHPLSRDATPSRSQPSPCLSGADSMVKAAIPGPGPLLRARRKQFGRASLVETLGQSRPDRLLALHYSSPVHDSTNSRFRISKAFFIGTLALCN